MNRTSSRGLSETTGAGDETPSLRDMESVISRILQAGVVASVVIVLTGVILWTVTGATGYPEHHVATSVGAVLKGAAALQPGAVIQAGLLVLILTPVLRVAASVLVFWRNGDRIFTAITVAVLALLLFGIFWGAGGG